jgi:hypothetical protein
MNLNGSAGTTYLSILGNYIHDVFVDYRGQWPASKAYGIYFAGYGIFDHVDVGWNEIAYVERGRGIQIYGHTVYDSIDNLYIHDNYFDNNGFSGVLINGGDIGYVYKKIDELGLCLPTKCMVAGQTDPCCTCTGTNVSPETFNKACIYSFVKNAHLYNNIFKENGFNLHPEEAGAWPALKIDAGVTKGGFGGTYFVYNNTFYNNYIELSIEGQPTYQHFPNLAVFKNNIFFNNTNGNLGGDAYYTCSNCTGENNLFYSKFLSKVEPWFKGSIIEKDPQFIGNPPQNVAGFALKATRPGIAAGLSTAPVVLYDFVGIKRPSGANYSIGAYEWENLIPPASPYLHP